MEPLFKNHFLRNVNRMIRKDEISVEDKACWPNLKETLFHKKRIVYAKSPMGSVSQVVEYLARYANKVAISNHRIVEVTEHSVEFVYKDYNENHKTKRMTLSKNEFIRRFEQHILPAGFVKMRHYGILGNNNRKKRVNEILKKMNIPQHPPTVKIPYQVRMLECYGVDITLCPKCKMGHLSLIEKVFPKNRGSPINSGWTKHLSATS